MYNHCIICNNYTLPGIKVCWKCQTRDDLKQKIEDKKDEEKQERENERWLYNLVKRMS